MYNIGELSRKQFGRNNVVLVGFGTYRGTVVAGDSWGAPMEVMNVPAGMGGSREEDA